MFSKYSKQVLLVANWLLGETEEDGGGWCVKLTTVLARTWSIMLLWDKVKAFLNKSVLVNACHKPPLLRWGGHDICSHIGTFASLASYWESWTEKFACQWHSHDHIAAHPTWVDDGLLTNNLPYPCVGLYRQSIIYSVCKLTLDTTRPCFCSSPPLPKKK